MGGVHLPLVSTCFLNVLVFPYLTVSNGHSLTALKSIEVTQSSGSFKQGGTICLWYLYPYIYWYFLIFSNKLTVSNGFSLTV